VRSAGSNRKATESKADRKVENPLLLSFPEEFAEAMSVKHICHDDRNERCSPEHCATLVAGKRVEQE
jgi:hypothetical protein